MWGKITAFCLLLSLTVEKGYSNCCIYKGKGQAGPDLPNTGTSTDIETCFNTLCANRADCAGATYDKNGKCFMHSSIDKSKEYSADGFSLYVKNCGAVAISIKRVDAYTEIWTDRGSGADKDSSIWRPADSQIGFYPLGDSAINTHSKPTSSAVMVRELKSGALREPESFELIWNDRGSGADKDVAVYKMNAPTGYTCLGSVAIAHHQTLPSKGNYRCVNSNYLADGLYEHIWNDKGSGADKDVSLWRVYKDQSNENGIGANTFIASSSYSKPSETPKVLDSRSTINEELIPAPSNIVIYLYPAASKTQVWSDRGSGADADFSCWRPNRYASTYKMGDVPHNSHSEPHGGFVAKSREPGLFASPVAYDKIWTDAGSGADQDGSFWRPRCPSGYRYISYACSGNHQSPPLDAVTCVKAEHTVQGTWQQIWTDKGSGANDDVAVYMARPRDSGGQEVKGLGAVQNQGSLPTSYVLKASSVHYVNSKPVKQYTITSVSYHLDRKTILGSKLDDLKVMYVSNNGTDCQSAKQIVSETVQESHSWTFTAGLEISSSMSLKAGLPFGETTVSLTTKVSTSFSTQDTKTTSKTISIWIEPVVRPCQMIKATMTGRRYTTDVPFTASMTVTYTDNTVKSVTVDGVYRGVTVSEASVNLGDPFRILTCTHPDKACK